MSIFEKFHQIETERAASKKISWIIAGLGNPGFAYENTRHNVGFLAVDHLAEQNHAVFDRTKFQSKCADTVLDGQRVLLMKPETYMNLSGNSIAPAADFYEIDPDHILVLYDDITLAPGKIRVRGKGSAGGHNGMKSIIAMLGTDEFPRIRIGIGEKPHPQMDLADWVLSKISDSDMERISPAIDRATQAASLVLSGDISAAMNQFNA